MQVSFNGNYISPATVQKRGKNGVYNDHKVSFVKIDLSNGSDIFALQKINDTWQNATFITDICDDASFLHENKFFDNGHEFYVLTTQKKEFHKLNPDEILAGTSVSARPLLPYVNIEHLEIKPGFQYPEQNRLYKKVGTGMIEALKKVFSKKDITLHSIFSALDFYKSNGFIQLSRDSRDLRFFRH